MSANEEEAKALMNIAEEIVGTADQQHTERDEAAPPKPTRKAAPTNIFVKDGPPIMEPLLDDVLSGRGQFVNSHKANQKFRSLCFARKADFEAGNHPVKRRVAVEIVNEMISSNGRFLKRKEEKGPWFQLTTEKAILKAQQVMRDFQRTDRIERRQKAAAREGARKRTRAVESTPGASEAAARLEQPMDPIVENPYGVHDHDILAGRGANVNGHVGNKRFRELAIERKKQFDSGNYSEKRSLASEVVQIIRTLDPPGRFLMQVTQAMLQGDNPPNLVEGVEGDWVELSDEKAIHKACQVMRDLERPDRVGGRSKKKKKQTVGTDGIAMLAETTTNEASVVEEAVAATEEALDKVLDSPVKLKTEHV